MNRSPVLVTLCGSVFLAGLLVSNAISEGQSLGSSTRSNCPVTVPRSVLAQIKEPAARAAAQTVALTPDFIARNGGASAMIAQLEQQIRATDRWIAQEEANQRELGPGRSLGVELADRQRALQAQRDSRALSVAMIDMLRCTQSNPTVPGRATGAAAVAGSEAGDQAGEDAAILAECGEVIADWQANRSRPANIGTPLGKNSKGLTAGGYTACAVSTRATYWGNRPRPNFDGTIPTAPVTPVDAASDALRQIIERQAPRDFGSPNWTAPTPTTLPASPEASLLNQTAQEAAGRARSAELDALLGGSAGSCTASVSFEEVNRVGNVVSFKMRVRHNGPENSRVQLKVRASDSAGQAFEPLSWDSEVPSAGVVSPRTVAVPFTAPLTNEEQAMCANLPAFTSKLQQERDAMVRRVDALRTELRRLDEHRASLENIETLAGIAQWTVGAKASLDTIKNVLSTATPALKPALKPAECGTVAFADFAFSIPQWCRDDVKDSFVKTCADGLSDAVAKAGAAGLACANLPLADHLLNATSLLKDLGTISEAGDAKSYARDMLDEVMAALRQHRASVDDLVRDTRTIDAAADALTNLCTSKQRQSVAPVSLEAIGVSCVVPGAPRRP